MLIGDFSTCLTKFQNAGSFGTDELDEHLIPLDDHLIMYGVDPSRRAFYILLSFLINQGTEWDAFAMPYGEAALYSVLAKGRHVLVPSDTQAAMIVLRKPPIRHGVIELEPCFQATADPAAVRAPAICFLAFDTAALFLDHAAALGRNRHDGQAYAFLLRFDLAEVDAWLAAFRPLFEPFLTCFWMNTTGADGGSEVVALITTDVAQYEI